MMNHRIALGVLLLVLVVITGGLWFGAGFIQKRGEGSGKHDEPDRPRIAALSPAVAVTLRDLGLAHLVVGKHHWDVVLPANVPVCGDQTGIDYEALLAVKPTHILTQWGTRDLPARLAQLSAVHGWRVADHRLLTLDDVRDTAWDLADEFGRWAGDDAVLRGDSASVVAALEEAWSRREYVADAGRVLMLASVDPPAALGPGSSHHDLLVRLGGVSAIERGGPYVPLDLEAIMTMRVDVIVLLRPRANRAAAPREGGATREEIERALGPLAKRPITAIAGGRVVLIDDPLCLTPATSLVGVARRLSEELAEMAKPK